MLTMIYLFTLGIKDYIKKNLNFLLNKRLFIITFTFIFIIMIYLNPIMVETLAESEADLESLKQEIAELKKNIIKQELKSNDSLFISCFLFVTLFFTVLAMINYVNSDLSFNGSILNLIKGLVEDVNNLENTVNSINTPEHLKDISEISRLLKELKFKHEILNRADSEN